ncbi:Cellulose synthase operon protein C precursor [Marinomonas spartinae]|uniref:cellulose biosynthesis protein BcsC n=1 Tax=Marinomonas spartinae TaxID=1792290 RepID=UPI000808BAD8|nr:cellulose biosynthesis protein BcsC [Marinomonas spartinae]SBS26824.1 Cellulose synthase operon protein C precursor [Marinomonas spartinae]
MNNKKCLLVSLLLMVLSSQALSAQNSTEQNQYNTLFQQADFWIAKQRPNLAEDSLQRILLSDPNNLKALYKLALLSAQNHDAVAKKQYVDKIKSIDPDSLYLARLQGSLSNDSLLSKARALSSEGRYSQALSDYQKAFNGYVPPEEFAVEYYLTLAGTKGGVDRARKALYKLYQEHSHNSAFKIAYAKVLTYKESTRRRGIEILEKEDKTHPEVDKIWRQALLWLGAKPSDRKLYNAYLNKYPNDREVAAHFKKTTTLTATQAAEMARVRGYKAYKKGQNDKALREFRLALRYDKHDAASMAGIGLVNQRLNHLKAAYKYLDKAIKLAPNEADQWVAARDSAYFYAHLNDVKQLAKNGQYDSALSKLNILKHYNDKQKLDAQITKADILQKENKLTQALIIYNSLLIKDSTNIPARIGLMHVLQKEGEWGEASALAQTLPLSAQQEFKQEALSQALVLKSAAESQPASTALDTLKQASNLAPSNPWIRLGLARSLNAMGKSKAAESLLTRGVNTYGTATDRYVAALYEQDQKQWSKVVTILKPIPKAQLDTKIVLLKDRAALHLSLARVKQRQNVGDMIGARKIISTLYQTAPSSVSDEGSIASVIYQSGQPDLALSYLQTYPPALDQPVEDYRTLLSVMAKAGDPDGASRLLQKLSSRQSLSIADHIAVQHARNDLAIIQADKLRKSGQLAQAYELLADRMRLYPDSADLLLAMGRLYRTGHKGDKALQIYQYVFKANPQNLNAIEGLISIELALQKLDMAETTVGDVPKELENNPSVLLLKARVESALGHNSDALKSLSQARVVLQASDSEGVSGADSHGIFTSKNPFIDSDFNKNPSHSSDNQVSENMTRPIWLPGEGSQKPEMFAKRNDNVAKSSLSYQVYQLTKEIKKKNATYLKVGAQIHSRNGESGLSRLDSIESPVIINTPYANGRFQLTVTPTVLNAGSDSNNPELFGTNALFASTAVAPSQNDGGVGFNVSQQWRRLKLDLGTTPLGFQESHLVGGFNWQPRLTNHLSFNVNLERRAIKDSLLSYAGTADPTTREKWGGVTKTGGTFGLNFDNSVIGLYGDAGAYRYLGNGVQSNLKLQTSIGGYFHVVNSGARQLLAGMDITIISFDHNMSKYSLGHGGYFSPQNYAALTLPITLSEKHKNMDFTVKLSPGFQSFSEDSAPFYPENASFQGQLNSLVSVNKSKLKKSVYDSETTRGFGISLSGKATYHLNPMLSLYFGAGYDNFGDYNQVSASLGAKYLMGVTN